MALALLWAGAVLGPAVATTADPGPTDPSTVTGRVASFESSDYSEVDNNGPSLTSNTAMSFTTERAYTGTHALKIAYNGAPGNAFGRVWYSVDWNKGTDTWYGGAFYVPDPSKLGYTDLIRWDNARTYGSATSPGPGGSVGDVGGVLVENGQMSVMRDDYGDHSSFARLTPQVAVPGGRWFWVEVHQRFSDVSGEALTELYLDGAKVGASTQANSMGRVINELRYGYVYNLDSAGDSARDGAAASTLYMDRPSISSNATGPRIITGAER